MLIRRLIVAVMAGCLLCAGPAAAQDPAPPEPSERQLELAGRYIELTLAGDVTKTVEMLVVQVLEADTGENPEQTVFFQEQMPRMMDSFLRAMIADLQPLYARTYTEEELEALVAFYDSPIGRSVSRRTIGIATEQGRIVEAAMVAFVTEFADKYCAEFGCDAGGPAIQVGK